MAAFPLPSYPGRAVEAEGLLQRLLRKKLEVGAEGWVEEGRGRGRKMVEGNESEGGLIGEGEVGGEGNGGERGLMGEEGLWVWAGMEANRVARGYRWGGVGEEQEDGEDEEDEDMEGDEDEKGESGGREEKGGESIGGGEGGGEMLPVGDVLKFLSTGREAVRK